MGRRLIGRKHTYNNYLTFWPDERAYYASTEERIVDIQGELLKVLKALKAVVGHVRKFLVDRSVIPLFEKNVSLVFAKIFV